MNLSKVLVVLLAAAMPACEGIGFDLDSVPFDRPPDAAVPDSGSTDRDGGGIGPDADTGPIPDAAQPTDQGGQDADASSDAGTPDTGVDMGPSCGIDHPIDDQRCNPTELGLCPENGICTLAIVGGPPPVLTCIPDNGARVLVEGDPCSGNDCAAGLTCVNWGLLEPDPRGKVCAKFCELDTNKGCADGQFCTSNAQLPPMDGIGVCRESCDPLDPSTCPDGSCNVDYNYPAATCLPTFRCVEPGIALVGDECGPSPDDSASCADGLVCYEVDIADFRCVQPCAADVDCAAGPCTDPYGTYGLAHCEIP